MSKIMSASSQNVAVEEQHQSQAPGSQQEIIEPNMNASSDESDDGCSGAKVGTVGLVGLIAGGVLGYVGHCKYENMQHQAAVDAYIAHEKADAEEAMNAGEEEVAEEGETSVVASEKPSASKKSASQKSNASQKSQVGSEVQGEAEEEDQVAFTVNNDDYMFCKILAPMEEDEEVIEDGEDENASQRSGSASVKSTSGSKKPSASKKSNVESQGDSQVEGEVEGETEEEEKKDELPKLNKQYVNLKKAYVTKEEHETMLANLETEKATMVEDKEAEITEMKNQKEAEISELTQAKDAASQKASTAEKNLREESKNAADLSTRVSELENTVAASSQKYRKLATNLNTVCGDDVPTLQSLKSLKGERVDALNIAVGVYNLSKPQVAVEGEEYSQTQIEGEEPQIIEISKLNAAAGHTAADFQKSLKHHICANGNKEFDESSEEMQTKKSEFTNKIDALNDNMASEKSGFGFKQNSTVFTFLLKKNALLINKHKDDTDLVANGEKLAELKKGDKLGFGCMGIQKNLKNLNERINPLKDALQL